MLFLEKTSLNCLRPNHSRQMGIARVVLWPCDSELLLSTVPTAYARAAGHNLGSLPAPLGNAGGPPPCRTHAVKAYGRINTN